MECEAQAPRSEFVLSSHLDSALSKGGSQVLRIVVHEPGPGLLAWMDPVMLRPKGRSGGLVQAVGELVLGGFANSLARTPRRRGGAVCCEARSREDRHYECQAC